MANKIPQKKGEEETFCIVYNHVSKSRSVVRINQILLPGEFDTYDTPATIKDISANKDSIGTLRILDEKNKKKVAVTILKIGKYHELRENLKNVLDKSKRKRIPVLKNITPLARPYVKKVPKRRLIASTKKQAAQNSRIKKKEVKKKIQNTDKEIYDLIKTKSNTVLNIEEAALQDNTVIETGNVKNGQSREQERDEQYDKKEHNEEHEKDKEQERDEQYDKKEHNEEHEKDKEQERDEQYDKKEHNEEHEKDKEQERDEQYDKKEHNEEHEKDKEQERDEQYDKKEHNEEHEKDKEQERDEQYDKKEHNEEHEKDKEQEYRLQRISSVTEDYTIDSDLPQFTKDLPDDAVIENEENQQEEEEQTDKEQEKLLQRILSLEKEYIEDSDLSQFSRDIPDDAVIENEENQQEEEEQTDKEQEKLLQRILSLEKEYIEDSDLSQFSRDIPDNIVIDNGNEGIEENQEQEMNEKELQKSDEDQEHETHKKKENQLQSNTSSKKICRKQIKIIDNFEVSAAKINKLESENFVLQGKVNELKGIVKIQADIIKDLRHTVNDLKMNMGIITIAEEVQKKMENLEDNLRKCIKSNNVEKNSKDLKKIDFPAPDPATNTVEILPEITVSANDLANAINKNKMSLRVKMLTRMKWPDKTQRMKLGFDKNAKGVEQIITAQEVEEIKELALKCDVNKTLKEGDENYPTTQKVQSWISKTLSDERYRLNLNRNENNEKNGKRQKRKDDTSKGKNKKQKKSNNENEQTEE